MISLSSAKYADELSLSLLKTPMALSRDQHPLTTRRPIGVTSSLRLWSVYAHLFRVLLRRALQRLRFFTLYLRGRLLRGLFLELLNTTRRIQELLLSCVERVTR